MIKAMTYLCSYCCKYFKLNNLDNIKIYYRINYELKYIISCGNQIQIKDLRVCLYSAAINRFVHVFKRDNSTTNIPI